jgi:hypothetical protein
MDREKRKEFRILAIVIAIYLVGVFIGLLIRSHYNGDQYIGTWKSSRETITIEKRLDKDVSETHELADGKIAKLIIPIRVRSGTSLHLMIREGLYDVDGNDAIIAFCDVCRIYVIFAVKRDGDNLLIGVPEQGDTGVVGGMWHMHYKKLRYSPKRWITYEPR